MKHTLERQGMDFSIHIAELVKFLREDKEGFPLTDRLLACGTRAGFGCREAQDGFAKAKTLGEAREQVREADYIIEMAARAGYLTERQSLPIREECAALLAALKETSNLTRREL